MKSWQLCVDTGGTFTDCIAISPDGQRSELKVLSSSRVRTQLEQAVDPKTWRLKAPLAGDPRAYAAMRCTLVGSTTASTPIRDYCAEHRSLSLQEELPNAKAGDIVELHADEEAPVLAARLATGTSPGRPLPACDLRLATTRATNALLERRGARVGFFVTRGFADLLTIGDQQRPDLFALAIERPPSLCERVIEVTERLAANGEVLIPLDEDGLRQQARALVEQGVSVAAVALAHGYRSPAHEQRAAAILAECGFTNVCCSSEISPLIGLRQRAETAVVDAYLTPIISSFVGRVQMAISAGSSLKIMTSAGGLASPTRYRALDSLLSGPAGGTVGAVAAAKLAGDGRVIAFDMGGTSTDVSRYHDHFDYHFTQRVGDAKINATALAIETVAAGGGSICELRHGRIAVGPRSAGATPGPACYGAGGPLTLTDVNLLLGRASAEHFAIPVVRQDAELSLDSLRAKLLHETNDRVEREALLQGFIDLANERMADAIRRVSIRKGYDPARYTLVAFGGAGPQHACGVADRLGMQRALVPAAAGVLSAAGLAHAPVEYVVEEQVLEPLSSSGSPLAERLSQLEDKARAVLVEEGIPATDVQLQGIASLRFLGQDATIELNVGHSVADLEERFLKRHHRLFGHLPQRAIEVESIRVIASSAPRAQVIPEKPKSTDDGPRQMEMWVDTGWRRVPCWHRDALDSEVEGPALIADHHCTTVVELGWAAIPQANGALLLCRKEAKRARLTRESATLELELFANRLSGVAEEMGELLRRTALSTNVKEREDFSCAILDAAGRLVVNAPHIPVHLGSLGLCVREVCRALPMGPGDVAITNHPAFGGSHLPDVTLIAPVFVRGHGLAYVANRAHHAELGGITPGSMPPHATCLAHEGVVIAPRLLVRNGTPLWDAIRQQLSCGPYPSRAMEENLADLGAQLAAIRHGRAALEALAEEEGIAPIATNMKRLRRLASLQTQRSLESLPATTLRCEDALDDGSPLVVTISLTTDPPRIDFHGCAAQHPGNLNATPAIVRSAVLYVLRLLAERPLPLNEGLLEPVEIVIPPSLLAPTFHPDPERCPAVVGGNVEVSQRLVDCLLEGLGICANSQGTMNNLLFGDASFGYYETICGGTGAGPGFDGCDAVHSHMTNTKMTDMEVFELRYPVRLTRFALRPASGGAGRYRGGDGVIRELLFLRPLSVSLLTQRRTRGARGLRGGSPGVAGAQWLVRANGEQESLPGTVALEVEAGDRLRIDTPGGGGYGAPPEKTPPSKATSPSVEREPLDG